ncbi:phage holin [Intestinibacter sp.]|uniref:phage holin n=1 Tax=Intestinibacter sp. TaxID=1965304 RepID=UPI002A916096|nr:phage holin [Intestinibacter sp.]MDY5213047.1 phage holin [Intestinibacter sp.]
MVKIMLNWKVRFNKKNILFITQVIVSVVIPVLTYFGLQASDLTTWSKVWETFIQAISNPYVVVMAIVSLFNAVTDPTTKGISDSTSALSYTQPK